MTVSWNLPPAEIEKQSFALIDAEAPAHDWPEREWTIVRRMIHTSADFEYAASVRMHPQAVASGLAAIREGRPIMTDTKMALAGISARRLASFGVETHCLIDHPDTARLAAKQGLTRSAAAVDLAESEWANGPGIYVVGNAPTALFRLLEKIEAGLRPPALIVGLPVGFVNAAESKAELAQTQTPFITNVGRKGGSNVAAAVVNALAVLAQEDKNDQ